MCRLMTISPPFFGKMGVTERFEQVKGDKGLTGPCTISGP